jgi:cysteine desulfurase
MSDTIRDVYLDHAATTYLDPRVKKAMEPFWEDNFGNPSSLYRTGRKAKQVLDEARATIARILNCQITEIIFTAGGTESDNLAILGVAKAWEESELYRLKRAGEPQVLTKKRHIITSAIEHHAVLYACEYLEKDGYEVTYLPVDADGIVNPDDVRAALRDDTLLVTIMYANNEIGTIQPVKEIAAICKEKKVYFHTDACQAAGALSLDVQELGVNLMTINGSKIYGPKGIGLLYIKQGTKIKPLIYGGGQEKNIRSGTENLPAIVGFAKALELMNYEKDAENKRLTELRDYFIKELLKIPKTRLNGHATKRLPNNVNVSILDIEGEAFILYVDEFGIACATGSACDSATLDPSHVILSLGVPYEFAHSSIRFTLGKRTSKTDLEYAMKHIVTTVEKLRRISPVHMELDAQAMSAPEAFAGQSLPHWQKHEKLQK